METVPWKGIFPNSSCPAPGTDVVTTPFQGMIFWELEGWQLQNARRENLWVDARVSLWTPAAVNAGGLQGARKTEQDTP